MHPVPLQRSRMRRGCCSPSSRLEASPKREARYAVIDSVSVLRYRSEVNNNEEQQQLQCQSNVPWNQYPRSTEDLEISERLRS